MPSTMDFNRDQLKVLSQSIVVNNLVQSKQVHSNIHLVHCIQWKSIHNSSYIFSPPFSFNRHFYISGKFLPCCAAIRLEWEKKKYEIIKGLFQPSKKRFLSIVPDISTFHITTERAMKTFALSERGRILYGTPNIYTYITYIWKKGAIFDNFHSEFMTSPLSNNKYFISLLWYRNACLVVLSYNMLKLRCFYSRFLNGI